MSVSLSTTKGYVCDYANETEYKLRRELMTEHIMRGGDVIIKINSIVIKYRRMNQNNRVKRVRDTEERGLLI